MLGMEACRFWSVVIEPAILDARCRMFAADRRRPVGDIATGRELPVQAAPVGRRCHERAPHRSPVLLAGRAESPRTMPSGAMKPAGPGAMLTENSAIRFRPVSETCRHPGVDSFRPTIPAMISPALKSRPGFAGSPSRTMPRRTVPTAPTPTQTA